MPPVPLALTILAAVLSVAGAWPEAADTIRGTVKPVPVSWLLWAAILAEGSGGAAQGGQVPSEVFTSANAAACVAVAWLAFRVPVALRGTPARVPLPGGRRIRLDWLCGAGGAAGLVMLTAARAPGVVVAISIGTDAAAYVPTAAHAWAKPHEESALSYALCAAGAGSALAAAALMAGMGVFTAVAYPAYLAFMDGGVTVMLLARRRAAANAAYPPPGPWTYPSVPL